MYLVHTTPVAMQAAPASHTRAIPPEPPHPLDAGASQTSEAAIFQLLADLGAAPGDPRVLALRKSLEEARSEREALRAALDLKNHAVFLLDAHAHIVTCNRAAERLAREARQLRIVDGRLQPGRLLDHVSWIPAALARLRHPASRSHLETLPGRRKSPPRHFGILSLLDERKPSGTAVAMLTLLDMQQPVPRHAQDELRRAFDFTAAEARIADALMSGMDTEDISNTFLIRRDTVRSHIKRLLSKTGTHGHADLQKLLLRISPNLVTLRQKDAPSAS